MTYGDGVADVNLQELLAAHQASGKEVTLTAVQPLGRFGALEIDGSGTVTSFTEKPLGDGNWINGGFFVCEPSALNRIQGDETSWEAQPLESLAADHQLNAFQHHGFWQPMDTLRDKNYLEKLWKENKAPWRVW
jgi:glucose-1-phosphate cytidylyltransferase